SPTASVLNAKTGSTPTSTPPKRASAYTGPALHQNLFDEAVFHGFREADAALARADCLHAQPGHIEHDGDVDEQDRPFDGVGMMKQRVNLKRHVDGARDQREPLRPGARTP